jgi:acyl carrier protein
MSDSYRLQEIFRDILDDPTLILSEDMSTANCPDWDSVATVQIVLAAEAEFGVRFATDDVASIRSVKDILDVLARTRR